MTALSIILVIAGPVSLLLLGLAPSTWAERHPLKIARSAEAAAIAGLFSAILATWFYAEHGLIEQGFAGIDIYFDALSATMLILVSFVSVIVIRYSRNYLAGDPGQGRFMKWLALTIGAVLTLIVSGNLVLFTLAWMATSLKLHQLLTFYSDRPAALIVARKKFVISRIGDLCLILAMALIYQRFGSLRFGEIFAAADIVSTTSQSVDAGSELSWIGVLLVLGALLKSAQFPFHSWLPEVMETPTPVSALMHAGIINAGGFLIVRMSHVMILAPSALHLLAVLGAITALFGALCMLTQTSVKKSLAFSTVGQMGFMMLQCGLGAFSSAILHIVAHSLYKAHAFLSSGSIVDIAKSSWVPLVRKKRDSWHLLSGFILALVLTFSVSTLFGFTLSNHPGVLILGAILQIALTYLLWNAIEIHIGKRLFIRVSIIAGLVSVAYFALQAAFIELLQNALPTAELASGPFDIGLLLFVLTSFMSVLWLQVRFSSDDIGSGWQSAYVHFYNGLYISSFANLLIRRYWPAKSPRHS